MSVRRVRFEFPDDLDPVWNPRFPEFSAAANGVSLLMPHVEPFVVRSIRSVRDRLDPDLAERADEFVGQELEHHRQHRRFNDLVLERIPGLAPLESRLARGYRWLSRRGSVRFNVAFAAGSETAAFSLARWSEAHLRELFDGADPVVRTLFLWHLAEEVEHKELAFDVHLAIGGGRLRYLVAALCSLAVLAVATIWASVLQLHAQGRLWSPTSWFRLTRWSLSLAFTMLPDVFVSAMPGHHPSQFVDPPVLRTWLRSFDPDSATMPLWAA